MRLVTSEGAIVLPAIGAPEAMPPVQGLFRDGLAHHEAGSLQDADAAYELLLHARPEDPDLLHLRGIIAHQTGQNERAVSLIEKAIQISPDEASLYSNCGEAYRALHRYHLSITCYEKALVINPRFAEAEYNLGLALHELGHLEGAIKRYEQALIINPHFTDARTNLGVALHELGRLEEARAHYEQALESEPYSAEAHNNLGGVLKALGKPLEALLQHQTSLRLGPGKATYHIAFMECLSDLQISQATDALKADLLTTLSLHGISHQDLAFPGASIVKHSSWFLELAEFVISASAGVTFAELEKAGLSAAFSDPLFLALLKQTILRDSEIERVLTATRSALLHMALQTDLSTQFTSECVSFAYALARQCFANEYVYFAADKELAIVDRLKDIITVDMEATAGRGEILIPLLACYIPLWTLNNAEVFIHLLRVRSNDDLVELMTQQVLEIDQEIQLRSKIESIGNIDDPITHKVRSQYEENPYPRWLDAHRVAGESLRRVMKRLFPQIDLGQITDTQCPEILVAGCGTGQQVIDNAFQFQSSRVLGVDISLSSLAYAQRKTRQLSLTNVEFKHADIMKLSLLHKAFDIIECVGVLHHMRDPLEGWRILVKLLRPGGLMRIGLYSAVARQYIAATRAVIAKKGYAPTPDGIRKCRQELLATADSSNVDVTKIADFYTLSETRDLLFHVQEHQFTLLQIADAIDEFGLTFIGFEFAKPLDRKDCPGQFSNEQTPTSLQEWHKYEQENTDSFIGLYLFWVQRRA